MSLHAYYTSPVELTYENFSMSKRPNIVSKETYYSVKRDLWGLYNSTKELNACEFLKVTPNFGVV